LNQRNTSKFLLFSTAGRMTLCSADDPRHQVTLEGDASIHRSDQPTVCFEGDSKIRAVGSNGLLQTWDATTGELIEQVRLFGEANLALDPFGDQQKKPKAAIDPKLFPGNVKTDGKTRGFDLPVFSRRMPVAARFSTDGQRLICLEQSDLILFDVRPPFDSQVISLGHTPFKSHSWTLNTNLDRAFFLRKTQRDPNRSLVPDEIFAYDLSRIDKNSTELKPIWNTVLHGRCGRLQITGDGKVLGLSVYPRSDGPLSATYFYDTESGQALGLLEHENEQNRLLDFSPDSQWALFYGNNRLVVRSLAALLKH